MLQLVVLLQRVRPDGLVRAGVALDGPVGARRVGGRPLSRPKVVAQRAEFTTIIKKSGMQGLIETLRAKASSFGVRAPK